MSRLLLDECVDTRIRHVLAGHDVFDGRRHALVGTSRRAPVATRAGRGLHAIITTDRGLPHQRPAGVTSLVIVLLRGRRNRLAGLLPLVNASDVRRRAKPSR